MPESLIKPTVETEADAFIRLIVNQQTTASQEFAFLIDTSRVDGSQSINQYGAVFDDPVVQFTSTLVGTAGVIVRGTAVDQLYRLPLQATVIEDFVSSPTTLFLDAVEAALLVTSPRPPTFTAPEVETGPTGPTGPTSDFYWGN